MNLDLLRLRCGLIAKSVAPRDTGNLRHSIRTELTQSGFRIIQEESIALYGYILNNGPEKPNSRVTTIYIDWWDEGVVNAVGAYISDFYNGQQTNLSSTYQQVAKTSMGTPARKKAFLRNIKRV